MAEPATAAEVARSLADVLERHGLPYAIGGAIALGFYTVPRATVDVDVNIFVSPTDALERALEALDEVDFDAVSDAATLRAQARAEGQFRGTVAGLRVDVFVPAIDYYARLSKRRQQVELLGRPAWIVGAEDLAVLKMMFFRRKDLADVEALLRDQRESLDLSYIRSTLIELVGPQNERVAAFDQIAREVGEPG